MRILLIAATEMEIEPLAHVNDNFDILITGVGVPATMYQLQKKLLQNTYSVVIQAGIAGAFTSELNLGEVVLIEMDTFGDIGMEENGNFTSIFQSGFINKNEFPFTEGWLVNKHSLLNKTTQVLPVVKSVTVNKVSDSLLQKQQLEKIFSPQTETMEGAAFHYVCTQQHVPYLQIRGISNYVGERDKSKWKIKEAIQNLNEALIKLIKAAVDDQVSV